MLGARGSVPAALLHGTCAADAINDLVTDKTTFSLCLAVFVLTGAAPVPILHKLKEEYVEGLYSVACCLSAPLESKALSQ